jgi:ankyrin repeat protein
MSRLLLLFGLAFTALSCDTGGFPPLSVAARRGDLGAIRRLLASGADPNEISPGGNRWPPLLHAVHKHRIDAARVLLDSGADPNSAAPNGWTALMMAASDQDPGMARLLLERGADARRVGPFGITALSEAVTGGALSDIDRPLLGGCHPDTVRALLDRAPELALPPGAAGLEAAFWIRLHAGLQRLRNIAFVPTTGTPPATSCGEIVAIVPPTTE